MKQFRRVRYWALSNQGQGHSRNSKCPITQLWHKLGSLCLACIFDTNIQNMNIGKLE